MREYRYRVPEILGDKKFNWIDPIAIVGFLRKYQLAFDQIQLSEGFFLSMIKQILGGEPNSLPDLRIGFTSMDLEIDRSTRIWYYCDLVENLLRLYGTEGLLRSEVHYIENFDQL